MNNQFDFIKLLLVANRNEPIIKEFFLENFGSSADAKLQEVINGASSADKILNEIQDDLIETIYDQSENILTLCWDGQFPDNSWAISIAKLGVAP